MQYIYFISDAHLGSRGIQHQRTAERRLVRFLDQIRPTAEALYILGDMFDFWFEYPLVVPRGFTRFLGKLSELTDSGVEVHYFIGNHDMWMGDYLQRECGVIVHKEPCLLELHGKEFYLAHGHDFDIKPGDWKTRLMFRCFESPTLQRLARLLPTTLFMNFGLNWAKHSRDKRSGTGELPYQGENNEPIIAYAKQYLAQHAGVNYFLFGHRHIELDLQLTHDCRLLILGEWITLFTYARFDGENLTMDNYIEGETEP